jgi:hypothetical protein
LKRFIILIQSKTAANIDKSLIDIAKKIGDLRLASTLGKQIIDEMFQYTILHLCIIHNVSELVIEELIK